MAYDKITTQDIQDNGVQAMDDVPKGTAAENKKSFDKFIEEVLLTKFNALVDGLESTETTDGASTIGFEGFTISGTKQYKTVKAALDYLKSEVARAVEAQLTAGSVTTDIIADGNVTLIKMASNSVDTNQLVAGAVTNAKIYTGAVQTDKIHDASNDTSSPTGITEAKIENFAVTENKIGTGAVTNTKLGANAVTSDKIADGAINAKLMTGFEDATEYSDVASTDTLNQAIGKLSKNTKVSKAHRDSTGNVHNVTRNQIEGLSNDEIIDKIYPVGSIYLSTSVTNPNTLFGRGTWSLISKGRVIGGIGEGDDGNNKFTFTAGEGGGEYKHTLLLSEMPSHNHTENAHSHLLPSDILAQTGTDYKMRGDVGSYNWKTVGSSRYTFSATSTINYNGGGSSHNNVQPYFGCYIWQRTA